MRPHSTKATATLLLMLFLALPFSCWAWKGTCVGISDGDTIRVMRAEEQVKVRLASIDCPELKGQPFGRKAKKFVSG